MVKFTPFPMNDFSKYKISKRVPKKGGPAGFYLESESSILELSL